MNEQIILRSVAISDTEMRYSILTFNELLKLRGINPNNPYRGYDTGNGIHIYQQRLDLEDVVKQEPTP